VAVYRPDDERYVTGDGVSFGVETFHNAPDIVSTSTVYSLGEEWDMPVSILMSIYEILPEDEVN
jgi:hypothetical protein